MLHTIILPLSIGFTLFLAGMKIMELALHRWAAPHLKSALERGTSTPLHGLAVGTMSTALLQSSTAVTVITIGMVNAGLLTFNRTLGIVLGTNIGTCITTELIGMNLHALAMPLLLGSIAAWVISALMLEYGLWPASWSDRWVQPFRLSAVACGGFALLLVGIGKMQSIAPHVQESGMFIWFMEHAGSNLLWGIAAGAALTAAVHSSAAVIGMIMGLVTLGAMPIELGIAVVLGANIGTCATALLASIGGSLPGQFVAWSHVVLNMGGALLFAPFIGQLHAAASLLSDEPASQIAHAQTIFNIASSLIALPLCYLPVFRKTIAGP
ncbi:Na/Pi cotransporter family protein [Paenibacillaceae bacterium]|nr:Na/Pi cotransporter family protein [Paenibacillaceae bacterium]